MADQGQKLRRARARVQNAAAAADALRAEMHTMRQELRRSRKLLALSLAEMRHRMINDYAVIAAMVQRCADGVADPAAKRAFGETLAIVRTVAETQKLLGAAQRKPFDDGLLQALAGTLRAAYGASSTVIRTNVAPDVHFPPEAVIPLCLIATEAIANSFKHALPHADRPELSIECANGADGEAILRVRDNGPGASDPESLDGGEGLRLMRGLAHQINGEFQLRMEPGMGAEVIVTFPTGPSPAPQTGSRLDASAAPNRRKPGKLPLDAMRSVRLIPGRDRQPSERSRISADGVCARPSHERSAPRPSN